MESHPPLATFPQEIARCLPKPHPPRAFNEARQGGIEVLVVQFHTGGYRGAQRAWSKERGGKAAVAGGGRAGDRRQWPLAGDLVCEQRAGALHS